jgi:hypothetical protein
MITPFMRGAFLEWALKTEHFLMTPSCFDEGLSIITGKQNYTQHTGG